MNEGRKEGYKEGRKEKRNAVAYWQNLIVTAITAEAGDNLKLQPLQSSIQYLHTAAHLRNAHNGAYL
jgi:flagellar biosynthesis/type III secretory pathway protein FliH